MYMDISIVILNYKSRDLTLSCIESIKNADFSGLTRELIVVDNDSKDGLGNIVKTKYPEIEFIQNGKNLGMGAGNNVGIRRAQGKYVAVMNPDTVADKDAFKKLFMFMEADPQVGVAGPKQFYPDGGVQDSCYRWYGVMTPFFRRTILGRWNVGRKSIDKFLMKDFDHNSTKEVDWLLGSFLFCRAEALRNVGMFDEDFFLYFEDTDLAKRFWKNNWKVIYFPDAKIIHNHGRESAKRPWYKFFSSPAGRYHFVSWITYLKKWGRR